MFMSPNESITLIARVSTGRDEFGVPIKSETETILQAFIVEGLSVDRNGVDRYSEYSYDSTAIIVGDPPEILGSALIRTAAGRVYSIVSRDMRTVPSSFVGSWARENAGLYLLARKEV